MGEENSPKPLSSALRHMILGMGAIRDGLDTSKAEEQGKGYRNHQRKLQDSCEDVMS